MERRTSQYKRQLITDTEYNNGAFYAFVEAIIDNGGDTALIASEFDRLGDSTKSHFEFMLRRLPCEGNYWDWPPGGALADPGGLVAWRTPIPEVQDAIAVLRQCVTDYWIARGESRDVAPDGPVKLERLPQGTIKNLGGRLAIWAEGIRGPEEVIGWVIDCFNEKGIARDWSLCEESDRQHICEMLKTYQPAEIPMGVPGPPHREWQQERERKYLILLGLLGLEPSLEWRHAHSNGAPSN